jgi:tetratricopeptide (TPR) repeat protein
VDLMDRPPPTESPETPSRTRALLASNAFRAAIVVLSAAIIFGAWAFAEYGGDETPDESPEIVLTLDDEYERARLAAESGDTDEALEILERILAADPDHEQAAALLRQLTNDRTATSPDSTNGQPADPSQTGDTPAQPGEEPIDDPAPRDDSAYLSPVSNMDSLLPQVISGWRRGSSVVDATSATVPFSPDTPGEISRALYSVNDRGSAAAALEFLENTSKVAYSQDGASMDVGVVNGYFGTDGNRLATVAFARGQFAFEVVVTVPGGDPASVKDAATALAREFEAAR